MALVLLTTASVAGVSMFFLLFNVLHVGVIRQGTSSNPVPAIVIAMLWSVIIFNLDRFLTMTMGHTDSKLAFWLTAAGRVAMAVIIGAVVSTPLVVQAFSKDIARYQAETALGQSATVKNQIAKGNETAAVQKATEKLQGLTDQRDGKTLTVSTPALAKRKAELDLATKVFKDQTGRSSELQKIYICEEYGTNRDQLKDPSLCSPKAGTGGLSAAAFSKWQATLGPLAELQVAVNTAQGTYNTEFKNATAVSQRTAQKNQPQLDAQIKAAQTELAAAQVNLTRANADAEYLASGDQGLLTQLSALERASAQQPALAWAHRAIWAIFFVIEVLPVSAKIFLSFGSENAYSKLLRNREKRTIDQAAIDDQAALEIHQGKAQARIQGEADMRAHEITLTSEANGQIAQRMRDLMAQSMDRWILEDDAGAGPIPEDPFASDDEEDIIDQILLTDNNI